MSEFNHTQYQAIYRRPVASANDFSAYAPQMAAYWARTRERPLPSWQDYQDSFPAEMQGDVLLYRRDAPYRFTCCHAGHHLRHTIPWLREGVPVTEENGWPAASAISRFWEKVIEDREMIKSIGTMAPYGFPDLEFESLTVPLTDDKGEKITHILTVMVLLDELL